MKIVFLAFLVFGTASPNANAALNIVRSNKALLLCISDSAAIETPAAGIGYL